MAGTETNNEFDEFIVDSCKLTLVNDIQNKVERMFSINIYVDESTDNKGEKSWLRVDGQKCDRKNARVMFLKGLLSVQSFRVFRVTPIFGSHRGFPYTVPVKRYRKTKYIAVTSIKKNGENHCPVFHPGPICWKKEEVLLYPANTKCVPKTSMQH